MEKFYDVVSVFKLDFPVDGPFRSLEAAAQIADLMNRNRERQGHLPIYIARERK